MIAEGDKVAIHGVIRATHLGMLGTFMGVPPSNKRLEWTLTMLSQLEDGQIVRVRDDEDMLGLFRQNGASPR